MFASGQQPYPAGVGRVPLRGFWIRGTLSGGGGGWGTRRVEIEGLRIGVGA